MEKKLKCVAISDLHGNLPNNLPDGDVLCICGDLVPLEYQRDLAQSVAWFCLEFVPWTDSLPYRKVMLVAGNHDFFLHDLHKSNITQIWDEKNQCWVEEYRWRKPSDVLKRLLPGINKGKHKIVYLCDNSVEVEGKVFYGTPWISDLKGWAFYLPEEELQGKWSTIPKRCDVFMSHLPPKLCGVGQVQQRGCFNSMVDYGSESLAQAILDRNITWAISGHVHTGVHYPQVVKQNCFVANVSVKDENYKVNYNALEFEV